MRSHRCRHSLRLLSGLLATFTVSTSLSIVAPAPAHAAEDATDATGRTVLRDTSQLVIQWQDDAHTALDLGLWTPTDPSDLSGGHNVRDDGANPVHDSGQAVVHIRGRHNYPIPNAADWRLLGPAGADVIETGQNSVLAPTHTDDLFGVNRTAISLNDISTARQTTDGHRRYYIQLNVVDATVPGRAFMFGLNTGSPGILGPDAAAPPVPLLSSLDPEATDESRAESQYNLPMNFNNVGVYCLDLRAKAYLPDLTPVTSDVETVRFVVGDWDTWGNAECGAGPELPGNYYDNPEIDVWDQANNKVLETSHSDIAPRLNKDGDLTAGIHQSAQSWDRWWDFANTVVYLPDAGKVAVPEPWGSTLNGAWYDTTYLGEPGTELWRIPTGQAPEGVPFLGYSGEEFRKADFIGAPQWRLDSVTSTDGGAPPGKVWLGSNAGAALSGAATYFATTRGLPQAQAFSAASHVHSNWDFSAPGTYCIAMAWQGIRADTRQSTETRRVMTVVVGGDSYDPTTAKTCEQAQHDGEATFEPGTPSVSPAGAEPGRHVIAPTKVQGFNYGDFAVVRPRLTDDGLEIGLIDGTPFGAGTRHSIDDVVLHQDKAVSAGAQPFQAWWGDRDRYIIQGPGHGTQLGLSFEGLEASLNGLDGDLTWALGDVRGPGEVDLSNVLDGGDFVLSTIPSRAADTDTLRRGIQTNLYAAFQHPGVYCLPLTLSGTRAGGSKVSANHTLTVAVGVSVEGVQPGDACVASAPADDQEPEPEPDPRPDSGRTVLATGHVDILSTLNQDGLAVTIHDDSVEPSAEHNPGASTLVVAPAAASTLGASATYAFLGDEGDKIWTLPQTQDQTLLWPGWNLKGGSQTLTSQSALAWQLGDVDGPGEIELFQSDGFGKPERLLSTQDSSYSSFTFAGHGHGNWAFTSDGAYCLPVSATEKQTGRSSSFTLLFAVGDLKPEKVTEADCGKTADEIEGRGAPDPGPEAVATTITAAPVTQVYGKTAKLSVTVSPKATGQVRVKAGAKTVTGTLSAGKATLALPAKVLAPGKRTVTLSYAGMDGKFQPSSGTAKVTVVKTKPTVKVKAPKKVKRGKTATITVTVKAPGVQPGGKVKVTITGAKAKTVTVSKSGKATTKIKIAKKTKTGVRKVTVAYQGDTFVAKATTTARVKVTR